MKAMMKKAGSAVPSANRITLLRDADGDGIAETRSVFLSNLNSPFGMALIGDALYVANTGRAGPRSLSRRRDAHHDAAGMVVANLPAGTLNHHWTKSVIASPDGSRLFVGIGSNSNAAENGIEQETDRAGIWAIDPHTGDHRVFASGLRNPVGMAWEPEQGALWVRSTNATSSATIWSPTT
jgi:glucose/arabinose dehydrogenase